MCPQSTGSPHPARSSTSSYPSALRIYPGEFFSRLLTQEAARILVLMGAVTRIFEPSGLPLPDDAPTDHPKVQELRELVMRSEGLVWCSPERHGPMSAVFKAQIDWMPLTLGAVRPSQGKPKPARSNPMQPPTHKRLKSWAWRRAKFYSLPNMPSIALGKSRRYAQCLH